MKIRRLIRVSVLGAAALWLLSCFQSDPERHTDLVFALDSSLVGKFDSVRVSVLPADTSEKTPYATQDFRLAPGQSEIRMRKPSQAPAEFRVEIRGVKAGQVVYHKRFAYAGGKVDASKPPVDILPPRAIPPRALSVADTNAPLFGTLAPRVDFDPPETTERGLVFTSLDSSLVEVSGGRLRAKALGTAQVVAASQANGVADTFEVTVREPLFEPDIKPITTEWCGNCHAPGRTFNLQDSGVLVLRGSKAMVRLALPLGDSARMPADTVMDEDDRRMLLYWLQQNVRPVLGLSVIDTALGLGDSILPRLNWSPANATNQNHTLVSSNPSKVAVSGRALIAHDTGTANIEVTAEDGGFKHVFRVTVGIPDFETRIKPITASRCGHCHGPAVTFNLQDSAVLIKRGSEAMRRLQLPAENGDHMPPRAEPQLEPREFKALMAWLRAHFVRLDSVQVGNLTLRVGDTLPPPVTFFPANATNRNYSLIVVDTAFVKKFIDARSLIGRAVGTAAGLILETEESRFQKGFSATVTARPMDSIRGVDTGGPVGTLVSPRILFWPAHASDTAWTLISLSPTLASIQPGLLIRGDAVGTAKIQVASRATPAVRDTFDFGVGPIKVTGISAADQSATIGSTFDPNLTWSPTTATNKTYSLGHVNRADTAIVEILVSAPGQPPMRGRAAGRAEIFVQTADGGFRDTFTVTIGNVRATAINLNLGPTLYVDTVYAPTVSWTPANTTLKTYALSTTTPGTTLLPTATTVRGQALGAARIIATATDGPKDTVNATFLRPPYAKVLPILSNRCNSCHAVDNPANLAVMVDSTVTAGMSRINPAVTLRSEIVRRIQLPVDNAQHMPANGTYLSGDTLSVMIRYFSW